MPGVLYDPRRLRSLLTDEGLDALVLSSSANILYGTCYRKSGAALALLDRARLEQPLLVVPASDIDYLVEELAGGVEVVSHGRFFRHRDATAQLTDAEALVASVHERSRTDADQHALLAEVLVARGYGASRIGMDAPLPLLAQHLPKAALVDASPLVRRLRMVKTPQELERLRRSVELAEEAIKATVAHVSPGVSQKELAAVFNTTLAERFARTRMDNVSIGRNTAFGNANVPDDVVARGAVIRFDVGAVVDGYCSDLSRCFAVEPVAPRTRAYYEALLAGQQAALDALRPGVTARSLFETTVSAVRGAGIPHYERTNVGHGIGLWGDGYDAPLLGPRDDTPIEPGMVLCVETPYYELGFGGLQVEDMVLVNDSGYEMLSTLPRELRSLS